MSAPRTIVIDGYNLILRSPAFRPDGKRDLREARDKLVNLLSWAVGRGDVEFLVVFDGSEDAGAAPPNRKSGRVTVRFSKPPAKADDLIREIVEELRKARTEITVVTADLEVARHAREYDAQVVLSDLFAASLFPERIKEQVEHYKNARGEAESADKPLGFSKKELEEWVRLFSAAEDDA